MHNGINIIRTVQNWQAQLQLIKFYDKRAGTHRITARFRYGRVHRLNRRHRLGVGRRPWNSRNPWSTVITTVTLRILATVFPALPDQCQLAVTAALMSMSIVTCFANT